MTDQELAFGDACSRGFSAGNYANAYETTDLETALDALDTAGLDLDADTRPTDPMQREAYRAAFILGFFGSYSLDEIGDREEYDQAYHSAAGKQCLAAGYLDSRDDEYAAEEF